MKQAMLFAAGLGTRLRPLTNDRPKALVEVQGKPLLQWNIESLERAGVERIIVNVHHFADKVIDFVKKRKWKAEILISDERAAVLETGGGLRFAAHLFDKNSPILLHNTDILSDIDIEKLFDFHEEYSPLATLCVRKRSSSRYLLFDENNLLNGWMNQKVGLLKIRRKPSTHLHTWAFSGIHVVSPDLFIHLAEKGKFSIIDTYLDCCETHDLLAYPHSEGFWLDVGKPETLEQAQKMYKSNY